MFYDLALRYDSKLRRCDLVLGDAGDLVIDETPIPAILLSVGLDRRAAPDDPLPDGRSQFLTPSSFSERRGAIADGLNPLGEMTGSKLWLLNRAKHTETTRLMCEFWLADALAWAEPETGAPAEIEVEWLRRGVLGYRVMVGDSSVSMSRTVED
ncbi:phage GP46 family protein [Hoeflea sp.]|uniref:phage GP46 family protein n=1 Tax=Hoeflea sp. TaxID=1940281 RepID=UPI003A94FF22